MFYSLLDTVVSIFLSYGIYVLLVENFAEPAALLASFENDWSISVGTLATALSSTLAQIFFGKRVFKVSRNWMIVGVISLLSSIQFAFIVGFSVICLLKTSLFENMSDWKWIVLVPYCCSAICDTIITASLCWYLYRTPRQFHRTQLLVNKLIVYTVNTSLWTTLFVISDLVSFALWRSSLIYVGIFFLLSKLYTNSVLGILNSRQRLREALVCSVDIEAPNTLAFSSFNINITTVHTDSAGAGNLNITSQTRPAPHAA